MSHSIANPVGLFRALRDHKLRWLVPAVTVALVAAIYAVVRPVRWEASQAPTTRYQRAGAAPPTRVGELERSVQSAQSQLDTAKAELARFQQEVGPELAELPNFNASPASSNDLHQTVAQLGVELHQARNKQRSEQELLDLLLAAQADPSQLLATPDRLLESRPSLRRLKENLLEAQYRAALFGENITIDHPLVLGAEADAGDARPGLDVELEAAIGGLKVEQQLTASKIQSLHDRLDEVRERLDERASQRARHANLLAQVNHHSEVLGQAEADLATARTAEASADSSSSIRHLDQPQVDSRPVGPSRATIVLLGLVGGLLLGIGIVVLTVRPAPPALQGESADVQAPSQRAIRDVEPIRTVAPQAASDRRSKSSQMTVKQALQTLEARQRLDPAPVQSAALPASGG